MPTSVIGKREVDVPKRILGEDLVRVYGQRYDRWTGKTKNGVLKMKYWGDEIEIVDLAENDDPNRA